MKEKTKNQFKKFKNRLEGRRSESTIKEYTKWTERFIQWTDKRNPQVLLDWDEYLYDLDKTPPWESRKSKGHSYAYGSRSVAMSAVKLFLDWGCDVPKGNIPTVKGNILGEEPDFKPTHYSRQRVEDLQQEACNNEERALLKLGYDAIMRPVELTRVRKEDLDWTAGTIFVHAAKESYSREIEIEDDTLEALGEINLPFELSFIKTPEGKNVHTLCMHFIIVHDISLHAYCRHAPIVHRLQDGQPFGLVHLRARHKNPEMTGRYARYIGREVPKWAKRR